jgi:ABC-type iron transport system FetAB ATPase subunit
MTFLPQKYASFNIDFNINTIVKEILQTDLKAYDREIENRIEKLKNSSQDSLILDKIQTVPKVLYFDELSSEDEDRKYVNDQLEKYFDKKYIRTK